MATTNFADSVTLTAAAWFNDVDYITYDGATTEILVGGGAGTRAVWTAATGTGAPVRAGGPALTGSVYIGDTANANVTTGLTINQGAADDEILAFKSSDVAHGMTDQTETDTFGAAFKVSATLGGMSFVGFSEGTTALILAGDASTADTTKSTAGLGAVQIRGGLKTGTTAGSLGANANILAVYDWTTCRFLLDADGDSHQDVGTAWTEFDHLDDIATLDALSYNVANKEDKIKRGFCEWLEEKRPELERNKLVTFNEDGHHFVNMSKLSMLHTGAIRQIGKSIESLIADNALLKGKLAQLENRP